MLILVIVNGRGIGKVRKGVSGSKIQPVGTGNTHLPKIPNVVSSKTLFWGKDRCIES